MILLLATPPAGQYGRGPLARQAAAPGPAAPVNWLQELHPGFDYAAWFQAQTGHAPDSTFFGAYSLQAITDTLYIGFGAARPAESDGALLASSTGLTLTAVYQPSEQGFIGMAQSDGLLLIPGVDPTDQPPLGGHQWDWGNFYTYAPPGPVVKQRNLPNVIHTWGAWRDASSAILYAATGAHLGDYSTWSGQVYASGDLGGAWTLLADRDDGVGQYRTYDVIGFAGQLYVVWNDVYPAPCGLAESSDGGDTWLRLAADEVACRTRLLVFAGRLLALRQDQAALLAVDEVGQVASHPFPGFRVTPWAYNPLAVAADGYLYTVTEDGRVVRSADLAAWQTLAATDRVFFTVGYWPDQDWLVVAERGGQTANLWRIDLAQAAPIVPPQAPAPVISRVGSSLHLDWPDVTLDEAGQPIAVAGYRVYRSTEPYFAPLAGQRIASVGQSQLTDDGIGDVSVVGDVDNNYFYVVRAEDAAGNLSTGFSRVGEFDFAITRGE